MSGDPVAGVPLLTLLEAARWASSAFNAQPWRFVSKDLPEALRELPPERKPLSGIAFAGG